MTEDTEKPASRRPVWVRGFYMLLMSLLWYVAELVLFAVMIVQFIFALAGGPNDRLTAFGASLGRYLRDVALFLTYASDDLPYPFTDWPAEV